MAGLGVAAEFGHPLEEAHGAQSVHPDYPEFQKSERQYSEMMDSRKWSIPGAPDAIRPIPARENLMTAENRHDPYGAVHKGIRAAHMRCLVAIGAVDLTRDAEIDRLVREIGEHLTMCHAHLQHEDTVLHTALDARRPGASAHAAEDHDDHLHSFAELKALLSRLAAAEPDSRAAALAALYRRFGRFVADDLLHMEHEEHVLLPDLQAAFTDEELRELEGRIVAGIAPDHMVLFLDAMLGALPEADSAALLGAMRAGMPPAAYAALIRAVEARRETRKPLAAAA
jgi:hypothetical protein